MGLNAGVNVKFEMIKKARLAINSNFFRASSLLIGGTALAQGLSFLALPLLTRVYSPSDFSVLAIYASALSIISVAACLRFDIAIPLPSSEEKALNLLVLALGFSAVTTIISAVGVAIFLREIGEALSLSNFEACLWLLPIGIWLSSSYSALQFWATRKKRFSLIAKTRLTQSVGGVITQVGLGVVGLVPLGLIFGQIVNSCAGVASLLKSLLKNDLENSNALSLNGLKATFCEYDRFPKYSTFESLANSAGIQLPVIIIASYSLGAEAGFLMLASRVMTVPLTMVGGAVSQVYLSQAPEEFRRGTLGEFTARVLVGLIRSGVGPIIFIGLIAPFIFPWIFGAAWQRAGEMVAWMTPWFLFQFLASPLSMVLHVTGNQRLALYLQMAGLLIRVGAVSAALYLARSWAVEVYALSGLFFYLGYTILLSRVSGIRGRHVVKDLGPSVAIVGAWVLVAGIVKLIYVFFSS